jgi:signal transduction histidine kinase/CheY-like chemotaxis protein
MSVRQPGEAAVVPAHSRLFRKYAASLVAVVSVALAVNGVLGIWLSFQEQKRLLVLIQREQADSAATQIHEFVRGIGHQMGWLTQVSRNAGTEELHLDAVRLLRLEPAIVQLVQLDDAGRELLSVSRTARDVIASGADRSDLPAFREARANGIHFGPVYFVNGSEPYMTLAVAGARRRAGVSVAEINLKFIWDLVSGIKVGTAGRAYVVDATGHLIAHPDLRQVLRRADLSGLAQVQAARAWPDGQAAGIVAADLDGRTALAVSAPVAPLGWQVFIELPVEEAYAPVYPSMAIQAALLIGALGCAVLAALLLSRRMVVPIQALNEGAARIGSGDFGQRLSINTGDELEALGNQFNRMAAHLQESYSLLESKVEARTAELARARDQALVEHAEAERARQAAELANQTKSRFLAVVSHEIRTPINGIMGVFQLLDRKRLGAGQRRLLDMASVSGETLLGLIDAILDYARLEGKSETLEPRDFDLPTLLEATVGLMRPQAESKRLTLDLVIDAAGFTRVHGDPARLNRVLLNLLGNAIKFTDAGGISVTASITPDAEGRSGRLEVAVSDTGIGISEDMRERIFEEFVQADDTIVRRFGGTGLGLAISRRLAVLMGGSLTAEGRTGRGSLFRLAIPLARAEDAATLPAAAGAPPALAVLVVDDDAMNREVAVALVRRQGHAAAAVADAQAAIEAARSGVFDAILMDLHMPGMTGIEAAACIEALALPRPPRIIALTAEASDDSREQLQQAGVCAVLRKPLMDRALREALAQPAGERPPAPPAAAAFDPDGLIDEAFLRHQRALLGPARLGHLQTLFRTTTGDLIAALQQAREPLDRAAIGRSAHRLGGAAAVLGLGRLFTCAGAIDSSAADAPADALAGAIAELVVIHRDSIAALDAHLPMAVS